MAGCKTVFSWSRSKLKMILKTALILALGAIAFCAADQERRCGRDMSRLWLDIAVVVDTSSGMSKGLPSIAANVASLFSQSNIGNGTVSTRVGLISYNRDAEILAPLDRFQSADDLADGLFDSLKKPSSTDASYVANGLLAADKMFWQGSVPHREHYRKVVIVYASTYEGHDNLDPVPIANRLKSAGVTVITVAYTPVYDGALLSDLAKIATKNHSFANTEVNLIGSIQESLLQANCFCSMEYKQNRQSISDRDSYRYGTCLKRMKVDMDRKNARRRCEESDKYANLVSEYSSVKHTFVQQLVKEEDKKFYIGLQKNGSRWYWDQPGNAEPVPLDSNYNMWMPGYPKDSHTAVIVDESGRWMSVDPNEVYDAICEVRACDTDNFCDSDH